MLKIAICDDDNYICSEIERMILEYAKVSNIQVDIAIFNTGETLIDFMKNASLFDLIFLDIELGTTTGIEVGNKIRNELDNYISKIVFITSKDGYEQQLFDVQPFNFIKKPINQEKLRNCLSLAIKLLGIDNKTFEYKKGHDVVKVDITDIIYFESHRKQIKIVMLSGEDYFYETLENIKKRLPQTFIESHRSFLINFNKVRCSTKESVVMISGQEVPVSQKNLKDIRSMLINFERGKKDARL